MRGAKKRSGLFNKARNVSFVDLDLSQAKTHRGSSLSRSNGHRYHSAANPVDITVFPHPWIRFQWIIVFLLLMTSACQASEGNDEQSHAASTSFEQGRDYFPSKVEVQFANHFSVSYHEHYKVVRTHAEVKIFQSDDPPELTEDVLVLVQEGAPPPEPVGELSEASFITVPATTAAVNNDGTLAFLQALGRTSDVVAVGGSSIYEDSLRHRVERGEIGKIGYNWHGEPNLEVLLVSKPDIALMTVDSPGNVKSLGRARALGAVVAPTFEWAETHYLGRAEWVKYVSLFFNAEAEANALFDKVEEQVARLKALVASEADQTSALWGYYSGNGRWMMHQNNLEARLLADAKAINPYANFEGNRRADGEPISSEQLLTAGADVEHWIIGDIHASELPPASYMSQFNAWNTGKLYHNYKRTKWEHNAYDYYKTAVVRPDLVLADIISLLHPDVLPEHETVYFDFFEKP